MRKGKKLLAILLALCAALALAPAASAADGGSCGDNVNWSYSGGTLTIEGTGPMKDYTLNSIPWAAYRSEIRAVEIGRGVTSVGNRSFQNCSSLKSVTIPGTVDSIGQYAFSGSGLESVTIPEGVTTLYDGAFSGCGSLKSVTISSTVSNIMGYSFSSCGSLTSIQAAGGSSSYVTIDGVLFKYNPFGEATSIIAYPGGRGGAYAAPSFVLSVADGAFEGSGVTSVRFSDGLRSINYGAFRSCASLTDLIVPASLETVGAYAFTGCSALARVYYGGGAGQWGKITIMAGNTPLTSAAKAYNSDGPDTIFAIVFDANGGTLSGDTTVNTGRDGRLASLPTPTRAGYTFDGWYTDPQGGTQVTTQTVFTRFTVLYAHWTEAASSYTVTFHPNGGTLSGSQTAATDANGRLSGLPTPARGGYTFDGWYTALAGGEKVTTSTVFTRDTTVYAHWTSAGGGNTPEPEPEEKAEIISPSGSPAVIQLTGVSVPDGARVFAARLTAGGRFAGAAPGTFSGSRITFNSALAGGDKLLFLSGDFIPLRPAVKTTA